MGNLLKIGVLVSGSGTNLQSIIDHCEDGALSAQITCVISNNEKAFALQRAINHGIPAICLKHTDFSGRTAYDEELVKVLRSHGVDLVVLAGFMRIITPVFIEAFPNAIMNIHPALLPSFPGLHAQRQAVEYGVKVTGCTVHFVDAGPIQVQSSCRQPYLLTLMIQKKPFLPKFRLKSIKSSQKRFNFMRKAD